MKVVFNDRQVEIDSFNFGVHIEDSYIESAYYVDTEIDLTDEELDLLTNENQDLVYSEYWESKVCQADDYADMIKDREYE